MRTIPTRICCASHRANDEPCGTDGAARHRTRVELRVSSGFLQVVVDTVTVLRAPRRCDALTARQTGARPRASNVRCGAVMSAQTQPVKIMLGRASPASES